MRIFIYLLVFSVLTVSHNAFTNQESKEVNDAALDLHKIFNKKLITPLKLGSDKNLLLLDILNNYSKETLILEDVLKENLLELNSELKKKNDEKTEVLEKLLNSRITLLKKLTELEHTKLEKIKTLLSPKKLAYYFILQQKLINKFKKSIDISTLTEE